MVPKPPTVQDVARAAGVSAQTVSNVINAPEKVRAETQHRVQNVIDQMGYRPSAAARRLRTQRSSTICVRLDPYIGGISGVVLDRFVHALTEEANQHGLRLLVYAAKTLEQELRMLGELIDSQEIDAAVLTGISKNDPRPAWLAERGLATASFGRAWSEGDMWATPHSWVDVDGAGGTREATSTLLNSSGPRLAWLGWSPDLGTGDDRKRGWESAMSSAGISSGGLPQLQVRDRVPDARAAVAELLTRLDEPLDGFVCASDSLAIGAHLALTDAANSRTQVIGFDNTPVAEALGISSVEQLPEQTAAAVLKILQSEFAAGVPRTGGLSEPQHVLITPEVVLR